LRGMLLSFFAELVGARSVARFVGLVRSIEARGSLCGFLAGEVAKTVVFLFCVGRSVVEGCAR